LLSHHHVFVQTSPILLTQHILLNQLIFAETANFCLFSYLLLSHHQTFWELSKFLLTQCIFAESAHFADLSNFC